MLENTVLGSRKRNFKGWMAVNAETGQTVRQDLEMNSGSVVYADNRFYCLTDRGVMTLVKSQEDALEAVGTMKVVQKGSDVWAHPVICDGRLYVRYHDQLHCYDIRQAPPQ